MDVSKFLSLRANNEKRVLSVIRFPSTDTSPSQAKLDDEIIRTNGFEQSISPTKGHISATNLPHAPDSPKRQSSSESEIEVDSID